MNHAGLACHFLAVHARFKCSAGLAVKVITTFAKMNIVPASFITEAFGTLPTGRHPLFCALLAKSFSAPVADTMAIGAHSRIATVTHEKAHAPTPAFAIVQLPQNIRNPGANRR
jgi:hypothetical protein